jgi:hypothetical protein
MARKTLEAFAAEIETWRSSVHWAFDGKYGRAAVDDAITEAYEYLSKRWLPLKIGRQGKKGVQITRSYFTQNVKFHLIDMVKRPVNQIVKYVGDTLPPEARDKQFGERTNEATGATGGVAVAEKMQYRRDHAPTGIKKIGKSKVSGYVHGADEALEALKEEKSRKVDDEVVAYLSARALEIYEERERERIQLPLLTLTPKMQKIQGQILDRLEREKMDAFGVTGPLIGSRHVTVRRRNVDPLTLTGMLQAGWKWQERTAA